MFGGSFAWHFKKGLRGLKFGIWSNDFSGQGDCTVDFNHKTKLGPNWTQLKNGPRSGSDQGKKWTFQGRSKANQIQSYGQIAIIHENDQYLQVADQCNSQFEIVSGKSRNMSNLVGRPRTTRRTDTGNYKL